MLRVELSFQFHKGTIKTGVPLKIENASIYFNSIKVRLKQLLAASKVALAKFQFHKGTIRTSKAISLMSVSR